MPSTQPTLHILCGKIASGKSTLASRLAARPGTILVVEDEWLHALFAEQLRSIEDYARCSAMFRDVMGRHVQALLAAGLSVVLDFAANTPGQRRWFASLARSSGAPHVLHVLDVSDELCLTRLRARNASGEHPFEVTDAQFREFARHFCMPSADEGFTIARHGDGPRDALAPLP